MTHREFYESYAHLYALSRDIGDQKNQEYAHSGDCLANFKRLGDELQLDPMLICFIYFKKHIDSITSYVKGSRSNLSEFIETRFTDAMYYIGLLNALRIEYESSKFEATSRQDGGEPIPEYHKEFLS